MLFLVPTPIGHLEDITLRALKVLNDVDLVACEDTRRTGILLSHYGIKTPSISYHDHNERQKAPQLIKRMLAGDTVALVSDAGSPGISDPGFYLVRACYDANLPVVPLPGATAIIPALTASGLPSERFVFEGFLPVKKGRHSRLNHLKGELRTIILYESPHRLIRTLSDLSDALGGIRKAAVGRELTKKHEEIKRGTLQTLLAYYKDQASVKGELVVLIAPSRFSG